MKSKTTVGGIVVIWVASVASLLLAGAAAAGLLNQKVGKLEFEKFIGTAPDLKDKVILLEFWATWCPPCRQSIPHVNAVHNKFKDRGLVVIGVTNEAEAKVTSFMKSMRMDYAVALDKKLGTKFGVRGIPHAFIINREGVVVWEGHPMRLDDQTIEKYLTAK